METKDLEECKIKQNEYEKTIRNIDLKIVENNIKIYDLLRFSKDKNENDKNKNEEIEKIKNEIIRLEMQKEQETNNMLIELRKIKKDITNVYFNLDKIEYFIGNEKNNQISKETQVEKNNVEEIAYLKQLSKNKDINSVFNIKEQRIIDFENFFKSLNNISNEYTTKIDALIYSYVKEKKNIRSLQYIENKSEQIQNEFSFKFNKQVEKFKKDENFASINAKVKELYQDNKSIEIKIKNSEDETKELKEKLENLQDIYFVNSYVKKIIKVFLNMQLKKEIKNVENNLDDEIYVNIQTIAKKSRRTHMLKLDRWSTGLIMRINKCDMREKEYEDLISIIRKTENNCNVLYEKVINSVILLCDNYISLENVEAENTARKKILAQNMSTLTILSNGIDNIKKKYSKIPIIGRKISYILEPKLIDIK